MTTCIVCDLPKVEQFLDLGHTTPANKFLGQHELHRPEPSYPLRVGFCHGCGHVQLTDIVPTAAIFTEYLYGSSASDTHRDHLYDLSDVVTQRYRLGPQHLVMDIGCNDGTLLAGFQSHGVKVLGVDPSAKLAALAKGSGIERFVGFFNSETAQQIVKRWGKAAAITATNAFPHIPQLNDFLRGISTMLAPNGVMVLEMPYLVNLLEHVAFDTVYHKHVSYWALGPMLRLFQRHGLEVTNAECLPLHHGQLRVCVQWRGAGKVQSAVAQVLEAEKAKGIGQFETYRRFAHKTVTIKDSLTATIKALQAQGNRIAGFGAPAKGNTLLSFLGLGPRQIQYIADSSTLKQGRFTSGTHIPVISPAHLFADQPDYVLLLAWNIADEIMTQLSAFQKKGGRFILPVPDVRIIGPTLLAKAA